MLGTLDPFTRKCLALTSLTIATVGNAETSQFTSARDKLRYTEWARFISSVRQTFCFFSFKQGYSRNYYHAPRGCRAPRRHLGLGPIDAFFNQWLLPIVLESPWPHIKRMKFRSVGPSMQTPQQASKSSIGSLLDLLVTSQLIACLLLV